MISCYSKRWANWGISWEHSRENRTSCIAQLPSIPDPSWIHLQLVQLCFQLSVAASEVCLGWRPSCSLVRAQHTQRLTFGNKTRKRAFQLPALSPSALLSPSPSSTVTWCIYAYFVFRRLSPCCPCCAYSSRWCLALGFEVWWMWWLSDDLSWRLQRLQHTVAMCSDM